MATNQKPALTEAEIETRAKAAWEEERQEYAAHSSHDWKKLAPNLRDAIRNSVRAGAKKPIKP